MTLIHRSSNRSRFSPVRVPSLGDISLFTPKAPNSAPRAGDSYTGRTITYRTPEATKYRPRVRRVSAPVVRSPVPMKTLNLSLQFGQTRRHSVESAACLTLKARPLKLAVRQARAPRLSRSSSKPGGSQPGGSQMNSVSRSLSGATSRRMTVGTTQVVSEGTQETENSKQTSDRAPLLVLDATQLTPDGYTTASTDRCAHERGEAIAAISDEKETVALASPTPPMTPEPPKFSLEVCADSIIGGCLAIAANDKRRRRKSVALECETNHRIGSASRLVKASKAFLSKTDHATVVPESRGKWSRAIHGYEAVLTSQMAYNDALAVYSQSTSARQRCFVAWRTWFDACAERTRQTMLLRRGIMKMKYTKLAAALRSWRMGTTQTRGTRGEPPCASSRLQTDIEGVVLTCNGVIGKAKRQRRHSIQMSKQLDIFVAHLDDMMDDTICAL